MPLGNQRPTYQPVRPVPSHSVRESGARITARGSNPDWWNQYIEPQLETFQQQPLMRIKDFADSWLGDPTDPATMAPGTNLAVGWLAPGTRKGIAEGISVAKALKAGQAKSPIKKVINQEQMKMAEQYPNVTAHIRDHEVAGPDLDQLGSFFLPKDRTAAQLKKSRLNPAGDDSLLDDIATIYPTAVSYYRDAQAGRLPSYVKSAEEIATLPTPELQQLYKTILESHSKNVETYKRIVEKELGYRKPLPRGRITINEVGNTTSIPNTIRHEYGHAAMALKDDVSHRAYQEAAKEYGYHLNPNEIRARAIGAKVKPPIAQNYRHNYDANGVYTGTVKASRPQYDYMKRITDSILEGARKTPNEAYLAKTNQIYGSNNKSMKQTFWDDLQSGSLQLPPKYYDYLKNVEPGDYLKIRTALGF